ncbi:MAG: LPS assembly lipoprotein LptE [Myxococcota bacterium]
MLSNICSCGYSLSSGLKGALKEKRIRLNTAKNFTKEYGIELELIKRLSKRFLLSGVRLYDREDRTEYEINVVIKNVTNTPLSYRQGINVAYIYEYEYSITTEIDLIDADSIKSIKRFAYTENFIYFSADSPATTEANKRVAITKVLDKIADRFVRELSLGI